MELMAVITRRVWASRQNEGVASGGRRNDAAVMHARLQPTETAPTATVTRGLGSTPNITQLSKPSL